MTFNEYDLGDLVILRNGTFLAADNSAVDPPTVICRVKNPLGVAVVYTFGVDAQLEKLAVGRYRCTIKPLISGYWSYKWEAIDAAAAIVVALEGAEEKKFYVRQSVFAVTV